VTGCAADGIVVNSSDALVLRNMSVVNTGFGFKTTSSAARIRMMENYAITNTAGNYSISGTQPYITTSNRGLNELFSRSAALGNFTLAQTDYIIVVDTTTGAKTATLPAANACVNGKTYVVKNKAGGANAVTLAAAGSDTIDGAATAIIAVGASMRVVGDGASAWTVS